MIIDSQTIKTSFGQHFGRWTWGVCFLKISYWANISQTHMFVYVFGDLRNNKTLIVFKIMTRNLPRVRAEDLGFQPVNKSH